MISPKDIITLVAAFFFSQYLLNNVFPHYGWEVDDVLEIYNDVGNHSQLSYTVIDNTPRVFDINSEDKNENIYDRNDLYAQIRWYTEAIRLLKGYKEVKLGYYWNDWRGWLVEFRSNESAQVDRYLSEIYDICET
jgi:hypothetical protein